METSMQPLFNAGKQTAKVRFIMILSLVCGVWSVLAGIHLAQTYGLNPADGGVLAPLPVRLAWGLGVPAIGLSFLAGMEVYRRCYLACIEVDETGTKMNFVTLRWWGFATRVLETSDIISSQYHNGRSNYDPTVNASWQFVYTRGRKLPYILDFQGRFEDRKIARRLLKL
jgi:hypothetical protein